jgi:hypothetical protein
VIENDLLGDNVDAVAPSPMSRTFPFPPPRLLVRIESLRSFRSRVLIPPETPVETFVVDEAAAMAEVSVAVDAMEYDPYAEDDIDGA